MRVLSRVKSRLNEFKPFYRSWRRRLVIFLAVVGPSTITTMAGNDGAGVITYSLAGANLGYSILFTLPFLTLFYAVSQEMGSRLAIVTRKGLGDLIRETFGIKTSVFIFILILIANFGTILTNVAALKTSSALLGLPALPVILIMVALVFIIVTKTDYDRSQKLFLIGIVIYFSYVFSAIQGRPDWVEAGKSMIVPQSSVFTKEYFLIAIAVIGTTITPWGQFFIQSYVKDKKLPLEVLKFSKIEAYFGSLVSNFFAFFIIVATAATLYANKIPLISGEQAALAIKPFAGPLSSMLFSVGLMNAAIIGMTIISLSSAYIFSEFFGFEGTLDAPYNKSKTFYSILLVNLIVASFITIIPQVSLFRIVLYTQSLNGILLPLIFYFILKLINNKELMGEHVNSKLNNYITTTCCAIIVIASLAAIILSIVKI